MKLVVDLSALWASVKQMGAEATDYVLNVRESGALQLDKDLSSSGGIDIALEDIDTDDGVLSYQGRQVLLFIPDQGRNIEEVLTNPIKGRRFHVADCQKLNEMKQQNRFERYKATNNLQGMFQVYGTSHINGQSVEGEAALKVCMLCLKFLNYKGYKSNARASKQIHSSFDIAQFLSHYSTIFSAMPERANFIEKGGYADNWAEVSAAYRQSKAYCCEQCSVDLSSNKQLLHAHHINGNKQDNRDQNLMALCIDCHRKQPMHDYMRVKHSDMTLINKLRREQSLLNNEDWISALAMADTSIHGGLLYYQKQGYKAPVVGYELVNDLGAVVAELEAAWPETHFGIAVSHKAKEAITDKKWQVITVGEMLTVVNSR
jgi:hypothetical protein